MQTVVDRLQIRGNNKISTSSQVLQHGVFMTPRHFCSDKAHKKFVESKLIAIADRSNGKSLLRHVCFDRINSKNGKVWPRGGKIFGSRKRIADFIATLYLSAGMYQKVLPIATTGIYWDNWHTQPMAVHPYLDIDMQGLKNGTVFNDVFPYVWSVIEAMHERFKAATEEDVFRVLILMNTRGKAGKIKWSFHLHWPDLVLSSMSSMAQLALQVMLACPTPEGTVGDWLDTKVYSGSNQLLRLPYCGKMGNPDAMLKKIAPVCVAGVWSYLTPLNTKDEISNIIFNSSTCTAFPEKYIEVVLQNIDGPVQPQARVMGDVVAHEDEVESNFKGWMQFWRPVIKAFVLPNFIRHRQSEAAALGISCSFPEASDLDMNKIKRVAYYPASFRVEAPGDTFCCYDAGVTPHTHSFDSNAITYIIDLNKGRIAQQCTKCRPRALRWNAFIMNNDLKFMILDDDRAKFSGSTHVSCTLASSLPAFFLRFFHDRVCFSRDTRTVFAYDENSGCWVSGSDGNRIILSLVTKLNDYHKAYSDYRNIHIRNVLLQQWKDMNQSADEDTVAKNEEKFDRECRAANSKTKQLWMLTLSQRKDLIACLKPDEQCHQVHQMEPHPHLVPLLGCVCLDVFSWTTRKMLPMDYFVSTFNCNLMQDLANNDIQEFKRWQMQVCCGDQEYLTYKLRIMGLSLTLFNFDRSFYMPLGPVGRNGKSSESFLFNELCMSRNPARGYNLAREYLTRTGQDRKGANAADTVMMDMSNKSIIIADECRDTPLDGALIKTMVSGDTMSARNLYEGERTNINIRASLWIIANKTLKLDYSDTALMNRMKILPYNAQWVQNPADVKSKMTDVFQAMWVFQDDPYFKDKVLKSWTGAMATCCLYELHLFMKSLPRDPDHPTRPIKLSTIPVPSNVRRATLALVEKEHPVLAFISMYMKKISSMKVEDYVTVEYAFTSFQRFGKNENSMKIKYMNRTIFQDALLKEHIEVLQDGAAPVFKFYAMAKDVPNLEHLISADDCYAPQPILKRPRVDFGYNSDDAHV